MKNKIIIAAALLVAAILVIAKVQSCNKKKAITDQVEAMVNNSNDSTGYYRDLYNTEHEMRKSNIAELQVMLSMQGRKFDSVCERLRVKPKQVNNIIEVEAESRGNITAKIDTVWKADTSTGGKAFMSRGFVYNDKYMWLRGALDTSKVDIEYSVKVPINLTKFWKRKHKILGIGFGAKSYYIDGYSPNKNVHITGLKDFQVVKERPKTIKYITVLGVGIITGLLISK